VRFAALNSIRVKTLNEKSDVKALAKEIIDKCKLIHPSKILEVEQLLFYLQNRKDTGPAKGFALSTHALNCNLTCTKSANAECRITCICRSVVGNYLIF